MKNMLSIFMLTFSFFYTSMIVAAPIGQQTDQQKKQSAHQSAKSNSIAKPNWWKKPAGMPVNSMKKNAAHSMSASQINTMRTEPLEHFLDFTLDKNWQLVSSNVGMASAQYQITLAGKHYELAIIRMNNKVPLPSVLNIWQNKVGLVAQQNNQPTSIKTKKGQNLQLITIQGDKKAILVAYNKQQKYTFFRLFAEDGLTPEIESNFRKFLTDLYIKN